MADGKVVYQIVGDSKGLPGDMAKAEGVIRTSVGSWDSIVSDAVAGIGAAFAAAVAAGGAALAALGKQGIEYNAEMEKYRTGFTTLLGDAQKAADLMEQIKSDAAVTPFDVAGLTQAVQLLVSADINAADARTTILALGDAIAATGGGDDELARMAQNLQQVSNTGKATAVDVKQFAMAGINIYKVLADYLGVTAKEAAEMDVTFEMLQGALVAAASEGGRYFGAMADQSETFNGAVSNLGDSFGQFSGRVTEGLSRAAVGLVTTLSDMLNSMSPFEEAITAVFDAIADGVTQRLPLIQSAFETLGTAVGQIIPKFSEIKGMLPTIAESLAAIVPDSETLSGVIPVLSEAVGALIEPLTKMTLSALPSLKSSLSELVGTLSQTALELLPVIAGFVGSLLASLGEIGLAILPPILSVMNSLVKPLGEMSRDILPELANVVGGIAPLLEALFMYAVEPIGAAVGKMFPLLSEIAKIILVKVADLLERIKPMIEQLTEKIGPLISITGDFIAKTLELITMALEPVADLLVQVVIVAFEELFNVLNPILELLYKIASAIYDGVVAAVTDFLYVVQELAKFLKQVFMGDVKGAFETLDSLIGNVVSRTIGRFESFIDTLKGIGSRIKDALSGVGDAVKGALSTIDELVSGAQSLGDVVGDMVSGVTDFIFGDDSDGSTGGTSSGGSYTASATSTTSSGVTVGGGGGSFAATINITTNLDGRTVAENTMTYLDDTASTTVGGN